MHEAALFQIYSNVAHRCAGLEEHKIATAQITRGNAAAQGRLFLDGTCQALVEQRFEGDKNEARAIDAACRQTAHAIGRALPQAVVLIKMATQSCAVIGRRCRRGGDDGCSLGLRLLGVAGLEQTTSDEVYQQRQQQQLPQLAPASLGRRGWGLHRGQDSREPEASGFSDDARTGLAR